MEEFLADPDPGNVAQELALQRALLADCLERLQGRSVTIEGVDTLMDWASQISRTAERASRIEARTALTAREIILLETTIVSLLREMLTEDQAEQFSRRLAAMLGVHSLPALPEAQGADVL